MKLKRDYRISEKRFQNARTESQTGVLVHFAAEGFGQCPRNQRTTLLKRLTPGQRAFIALHDLEVEVLNGGLIQYFENSSGDGTQEALLALKRVGAMKHLALLRKVLRRFPKTAKISSRRDRQKWMASYTPEQMAALFDGAFYKLEDSKRTRLETLRLAYFKTHWDEFILPEGISEEVIPLPCPGAIDYRIPLRKAKELVGRKLHWALISKLWDDYFLALNGTEQEATAFIHSLSPGQRALFVTDLLHKTILKLNGFSHFLGNQLRADLLITEVSEAYRLLKATPYADQFRKVLEVAGDLPPLNQAVTVAMKAYREAKDQGDASSILSLSKAFMDAHDQKRKRSRQLGASLDSLSEELKSLLAAPSTAFELYVEAYVATHPAEFFKG